MSSQHVGRRFVAGLLALGLLAALIGLVPQPPIAAAPPPFTARASVNQVSAEDLTPGDAVDLLDAADAVVASATADDQGSMLFREVAQGPGYRVRQDGAVSDPLTVMSPDVNPDPSFYDGITMHQGYGYVPTRDGTTLSINVTFPNDGTAGPWPVVIDYSGYDPSQPGGPPQEALVFSVQGYVVVGVNMRGTGCSGGAFDFFEYLQSLDGYDVVEAVAAQSWSNGDVGLVGISYPGISQLFVAQTQPPHLRAITPLSVIADTYRSTLYPGGILNSGFALGWAKDRVDGAKPAARQWARDLIGGGDTTCAANQKLRLQARDLLAEIRPDRFYEEAGDSLAPRTFVDKINVPVYLSGQFQDEQTGGHFSTMVPDFTAAPELRVTLTNGTHVEPLGPEQMARLLEFVDFYVGHRKPKVSPLLRAAIGTVYEGLFGYSGATLPPDRFDGYASYADALAAYQAEPPVRVLWENGAGHAPGEPYATAETGYASWPVPGTIAQSWYLQPDGKLSTSAPTISDDEPRGMSSYIFDPTTKRASTFDGSTDAIWKVNPDVHWEPLTEGNSLSFVTDPFTSETAMAGWGSVDLWLRSQAVDTDLEVTLTEVRPDGQERFIQSGWLRASHRKLDDVGIDAVVALPDPPAGGCRTAARRPVRAGPRRAVPLRARPTRRLAAAGQHRGTRRQPAVLAVRHDHALRGAQRHRSLGGSPLEGRPAGVAGGRGPGRARGLAGMPVTAQPALPGLPPGARRDRRAVGPRRRRPLRRDLARSRTGRPARPLPRHRRPGGGARRGAPSRRRLHVRAQRDHHQHLRAGRHHFDHRRRPNRHGVRGHRAGRLRRRRGAGIERFARGDAGLRGPLVEHHLHHRRRLGDRRRRFG